MRALNGTALTPHIPSRAGRCRQYPAWRHEARYYEQLHRHVTIEDERSAGCGDDVDAPPTSTCPRQEGVVGGILQPAPTDDRRSWGIRRGGPSVERCCTPRPGQV